MTVRAGASGRAAVVAIAALALWPGCADDEDAGPATAGSAAATPADAAPPTEPESGELTSETGEVIRDWGPEQERVDAVVAVRALLDDFRAGRMDAACRRVSEFAMPGFAPAGTAEDASCAAKLTAYAPVLARRGPPERLRLLWVRSYTATAGVWVEAEDGERFRVPLSGWEGDGGGWRLELGTFHRPETLYARLEGAEEYLER